MLDPDETASAPLPTSPEKLPKLPRPAGAVAAGVGLDGGGAAGSPDSQVKVTGLAGKTTSFWTANT